MKERMRTHNLEERLGVHTLDAASVSHLLPYNSHHVAFTPHRAGCVAFLGVALVAAIRAMPTLH